MNQDGEKQTADFRSFLQEELLRRCRKNPGYSLRSFARVLKIDASSLSQMIRGKRKLSISTIERLSQNLNLEPHQISQFKLKGDSLKRKVLKELSTDAFNIIADWYHHALLELPRMKDFEPNPKWAARVLGTTVTEIHMALERLQRVGLLRIEKDQSWTVLSPNNTGVTNMDSTSIARRQLQSQVLSMAIRALDENSIEERKNVSVTFAMNSRLLPKAKKRIDHFRQDLCAALDEGGPYDQVYHLAIALYPVTRSFGKDTSL